MRNLILGESLEVLIDHRGKTPKKLGAEFTATGVPVASAILVKDGALNLGEARCVTPETFAKWMPVATRQGDVLLTSEAPLGRVARVPSDDPLVLGQRLYGLRGLQGTLDSGYLYYALQTERVQADLLGRSTGTTVFGIRQSALRNVVIPAPDIGQQKAIAEVLGALDDKIAANNRTVASASELAEAQWRHAVSRSHATSPLREVARLNYGKALPAKLRVPGEVVVFGSGGATGTHAEALVDGPGVVVGRKGTVGAVYWAAGAHYPIDTTFYVTPTGHLSPQFLFYALQRMGLGDMNSDSAVPGLNREEAYARLVPMPRDEDLSRFNRVADVLFSYIEQRRIENETLAHTRDVLLPLLMSNKLTARIAEKSVEEVV